MQKYLCIEWLIDMIELSAQHEEKGGKRAEAAKQRETGLTILDLVSD